MSPVHDRLSQLARGNLPRGQNHGALQARSHGVGRGGGRGVARGGTGHHLGVALQHLGNGRRHATILEGSRRVHPLDLDVDLCAGARVKGLGMHQWRAAFAQRDHRIRVRERKSVTILGNNTLPLVCHQDSSTRMTRRTPAM